MLKRILVGLGNLVYYDDNNFQVLFEEFTKITFALNMIDKILLRNSQIENRQVKNNIILLHETNIKSRNASSTKNEKSKYFSVTFSLQILLLSQ